MTTQTLRRYQLERKHFLSGTIMCGKDIKAYFKYAIRTNNSARTQLIHGFTASDNTVGIESVDIAFVHNSDTVELADGNKYTVTSFEEKPLDENQLRFLPWERVDKIYKLSLKSVG